MDEIAAAAAHQQTVHIFTDHHRKVLEACDVYHAVRSTHNFARSFCMNSARDEPIASVLAELAECVRLCTARKEAGPATPRVLAHHINALSAVLAARLDQEKLIHKMKCDAETAISRAKKRKILELHRE